jgi:hypothetical protein
LGLMAPRSPMPICRPLPGPRRRVTSWQCNTGTDTRTFFQSPMCHCAFLLRTPPCLPQPHTLS